MRRYTLSLSIYVLVGTTIAELPLVGMAWAKTPGGSQKQVLKEKWQKFKGAIKRPSASDENKIVHLEGTIATALEAGLGTGIYYGLQHYGRVPELEKFFEIPEVQGGLAGTALLVAGWAGGRAMANYVNHAPERKLLKAQDQAEKDLDTLTKLFAPYVDHLAPDDRVKFLDGLKEYTRRGDDSASPIHIEELPVYNRFVAANPNLLRQDAPQQLEQPKPPPNISRGDRVKEKFRKTGHLFREAGARFGKGYWGLTLVDDPKNPGKKRASLKRSLLLAAPWAGIPYATYMAITGGLPADQVSDSLKHWWWLGLLGASDITNRVVIKAYSQQARLKDPHLKENSIDAQKQLGHAVDHIALALTKLKPKYRDIFEEHLKRNTKLYQRFWSNPNFGRNGNHDEETGGGDEGGGGGGGSDDRDNKKGGGDDSSKTADDKKDDKDSSKRGGEEGKVEKKFKSVFNFDPDAVKEKIGDVKDKAKDKLDDMKDKAKEKFDDAKDKLKDDDKANKRDDSNQKSATIVFNKNDLTDKESLITKGVSSNKRKQTSTSKQKNVEEPVVITNKVDPRKVFDAGQTRAHEVTTNKKGEKVVEVTAPRGRGKPYKFVDQYGKETYKTFDELYSPESPPRIER